MTHVCQESKTCTCYLLADEPSDDCPVHGAGPWPPRCETCGKFLPYECVLLIVEANIRYWEDARVNGREDVKGDLIPFRHGDLWKPVIELATGRVLNWPEWTTADIHYKVCDAGEYWLADRNGNKRRKWKGDYVPDAFLCVGDRGYGDYIILKVGEDGHIKGWKVPEIDEDEWRELL